MKKDVEKKKCVIKTKPYAAEIINFFEDFLSEKGVEIENEDKIGDEGEAIIYGMDYAELLDRIGEILEIFAYNCGADEVDTDIWEN